MAESLASYLEAAAEGPDGKAVATTILQFATAAAEVQATIASGGGGSLGSMEGVENAGGDMQKELDVLADRAFLAAAGAAPVAFYGSEEQDEPVLLDTEGSLAVAIDPLDGSSNIDTNVSVGTIFAVFPVSKAHRADPPSVFRQKGSAQLAAGFFIYGPQLLLVMTVGKGTRVFIHVPGRGGFVAFGEPPKIAKDAKEYSINASNGRHWDAGMRAYVADLVAGKDGPRGRDFGMRYVGSMVADGYRILRRGGVFLYPGDARKGYAKGRLRLLYEAAPFAFCMEQAGGAATDGVTRILDIEPEGLHVRTPLVFGSKAEVEAVASYLNKAG